MQAQSNTGPGRVTVALLLLTLAGLSAPVRALDILSADELAALCLPRDGEPAPIAEDTCAAYVRGFLDGAIATDPRVTLNVAREIERDESFTERAYRTRLGQRLQRFGPSYYADFCIPQPVPLSDIVGLVQAQLGTASVADGSARELIYLALRNNYPCEKDEE